MELTTIIYLVRVIVLFFAIMYTFTLLRSFAILAGREAGNRAWTQSARTIIIPTLIWVVFWCLCNAPALGL